MKKLYLFFTFCLAISTFAQAQIPPQAFNYSAVARNAAGQPIASATIGIQISILKTSPTGAAQYSENHFVNTDAYGLFNIIIGAGSVQSGSMTNINWSEDNYYLKVGMDVNGGTNFLTMGTTQLLSVPYSLHAATADSVIGGTAGFSGNYNDLTNQPNLAPVATSGDYSDLINVPSLSPLATSGDYNDILNQPITVSSISASGDTLYLSNGQFFHVISSGFSGNYNDLSNVPILSTVASSGDYNDLINLPVTISSISTSGDTLYLSNGQTFINSASFSGNYNDLTNQPTNVSAFTNDAGYVSTLNDDDPTNEIQQLSVSATGDTLHLQNGGFVIIPGISAANNSGGGSNGLFTPGSGVTDIDGNSYSTIIINGQEWMAENLRTTKYANGDTIANVDNSLLFFDFNAMCIGQGSPCYGAWAHYDFNPSYEVSYGKLYNWFATIDSRNVCPAGWHASTNDDWIDLVSFLDPNGSYTLNCSDPHEICYGQSLNNIAGTKLKSQTGWYLNGNGTNESGFNALPGGAMNNGNYGYSTIGEGAVFWTSSVSSNQLRIYRFLDYDKNYVNAYDDGDRFLSIRCVKD